MTLSTRYLPCEVDARREGQCDRTNPLDLSLHIEKGLGDARAAQREGDVDLPAFARRISPPLEEGILSAL
jgi:hypothetical protein